LTTRGPFFVDPFLDLPDARFDLLFFLSDFSELLDFPDPFDFFDEEDDDDDEDDEDEDDDDNDDEDDDDAVRLDLRGRGGEALSLASSLNSSSDEDSDEIHSTGSNVPGGCGSRHPGGCLHGLNTASRTLGFSPFT